jgi:hypothetical protein
MPGSLGWELGQHGPIERVLALKNVTYHHPGIRVGGKESLSNRSESIVYLHGQKLNPGVGQMNGKKATTGAYLEDGVPRTHLRIPSNGARRILIQEEVLTQLPRWPKSRFLQSPTEFTPWRSGRAWEFG